MTAYEAKDSKSLAWPSRVVAYVISVSYFFCALGEVLNVEWTNTKLPVIYFKGNGAKPRPNPPPRSTAVVVLAAQQAGYKIIPGFLTGCMIFSVLSASNTALYVASRTLYGMTREITTTRWPISWLSGVGTVIRSTGVPHWALIISALAFYWLPLIQLKSGFKVQDVSHTEEAQVGEMKPPGY